MGKLEVFNKLLKAKSPLLKCIFSTLIFQALLTTIVFRHVYQNPSQYSNMLKKNNILFIALFLIIQISLIAAMLGADISFSMRFILFVIFSVVEGLFLGASMVYVPKDIIMSALVSSIAIFATFLVIGLFIVYLGIDLGWMGVFLLLGLIGLIISRIASIYMQPSETREKAFVVIGMILFSGYILFDTNNILLKYKNSGVDCIRGALEYYMDIINLFVTFADGD